MVDDRLRVYVNPMDRPGRVSGSHATWQALSTVIQREESYAMQEMKRDVERARMEAEDLRALAWCGSGIIAVPWRDVSKSNFNQRMRLSQQIDAVTNVVENVMNDVDAALDPAAVERPSTERVLRGVWNQLVDVHRIVGRYTESDTSSSDSDL